MVQKQDGFLGRMCLVLPPCSLLAGLLMGFTRLPAWPNFVVLGILPCLGLGCWFLSKRPLWLLTLVTLLSLGLGFAVSKKCLSQMTAKIPSEARFSKTYSIKGRYLRGWQTKYGDALLLDEIEVMSPKEVDFSLDRLTVYVPKLETFPQRHSQVTAWVTLKQRQSPNTLPWPILSWREEWIPGYYGSVKSAGLLTLTERKASKETGLSPGNQQLLALIAEGMPSSIWRDRLQPFGVGHLLAISGLHCIFVYLALQLVLWPVRTPLLRSLATALGLVLFANWVGWTASVTRAALMLIGWQFLPVFGRRRSWLRLWFALLLVGLIAQPSLLLMRGFWYSYAASLGLVLGSSRTARISSPLEHPLARRIRPFLPIFAAQIFVVPINLMFDGFSQFTSLIWNFAGFVFLVVLGVLLFLAFIASWLPMLVPLANNVEGFIGRLLESVPQGLGPELIRFPQHPLLVFGILTGLALSLHLARKEWRWYLALVLLAAFSCFGRPLKGERLLMLDVGQGLCVLHVDDDGEGTFYDAGGKIRGNMRLDRLAYLMGVKHIRCAYVSHLNLDHYQLLAPLPRNFPLMVSPGQMESFSNQQMLKGYQLIASKRGDRDVWGSAQTQILWPPEEQTDFPNSNEESLVIGLKGTDWWVLLTGDAGRWVEQRLELPTWPGSRVLQVGHHGSKSASGPEFLSKLQPKYALISCGRKNRFSHPHHTVITRLKEENSQPISTVNQGSILIILDGQLQLQTD